MIDRPTGGEKAVLVHVNFPLGKLAEDFAEFNELVLSAGIEVTAMITCTRSKAEPKYFVGTGKAEEIRTTLLAHKAQLVIFNHALTPAQERNLEKFLNCRVVDRTNLILDIFAQRARSFEGKLQVELAQLTHQSTRLVRGWTHLERQRGGIGVRGGPGETQLESDRRLIRNKIKQIKLRLAKLRKQRELSRRARRRAIVPTIALVGYTNAGKSTLFNQLTGASIYVADQLFATLDPTLRRVEFPEMGTIILADTVGFIRHLPHDLIEAFHATLEEVSEADLLLHVIDSHDDKRKEHIMEVEQVLASIHASTVPRILVYNKIDLLQDTLPKIDRDEYGEVRRVFVSATKELGMHYLLQAIGEALGKELIYKEIILTPQQTKLRAELYSLNAVHSETIDEMGNYHLNIRLRRVEFERLFS